MSNLVYKFSVITRSPAGSDITAIKANILDRFLGTSFSAGETQFIPLSAEWADQSEKDGLKVVIRDGERCLETKETISTIPAVDQAEASKFATMLDVFPPGDFNTRAVIESINIEII